MGRGTGTDSPAVGVAADSLCGVRDAVDCEQSAAHCYSGESLKPAPTCPDCRRPIMFDVHELTADVPAARRYSPRDGEESLFRSAIAMVDRRLRGPERDRTRPCCDPQLSTTRPELPLRSLAVSPDHTVDPEFGR